MDKEKEAAAKAALQMVEPGMHIGLGSGSTAEIFIKLLGEKNSKEKLGLLCAATSVSSEKAAIQAGLKVVGLEKIGEIDIAFDGADQVDENLNLLKGMGGALVREKIVDYRAEEFVVLVGPAKMRKMLSGIVPVEIVPFAFKPVSDELLKLGAKKVGFRMKGKKRFVSDNGNWILDAEFGAILEPSKAEEQIKSIPGVVDCGIFSKKRPVVIVGQEDGSSKILR
ncbi:MAG: ribose-5-phosphate isomerase RpiA [Candidatus Micrarchaeota archaeon]|nr:ribose-5-phosphate isomerase RpiA [Candidatus Micrarchaeota archaeon]